MEMNAGSQSLNRQTVAPLDVERSLRRDERRCLTSFPAGKVAPLAVFPILREDAVRTGKVSVTIEMQETAELIMNGVYCNVMVHVVPFLAFPRFGNSMDILNRSYAGQPSIQGGSVVPFIQTATKGAFGAEAVYKVLGIHAPQGATINTAYLEAYNLVWNMRAKNRSPKLTQRALTDTSLAPAFWYHENFQEIVPDFDQAVIDGQVALNVIGSQLPVKYKTNAGAQAALRRADTGALLSTATALNASNSGKLKDSTGTIDLLVDPVGTLYAEMAANGITVSLSNLDLAKKTQAFARLREQYTGHDDAFIIDMLMSGLSIPDQALKDPMLIGSRQVQFMQQKRYATNSGALNQSATNGATQVEIDIAMPRLATGGIIIVTAEVTPEQLFERKRDNFFFQQSVADFPDYLRDFLDPEKVEVVLNGYIDTAHATPTATFGYAPLNHDWNRTSYQIGGKYLRPADTSNDLTRMRLWAAETLNPTLGPDFYLATQINQKPFLDTTADPFEATTIASLIIEGNTVFGGRLVEAQQNYAAVLAKAPTTRIVKP